MQFSDVLASSVHDMKNSLGLVLNRLEALLNDPETHIADRRQANLLQLEVQRANSNLVQLLALYKLGNQQLEAHLMEHNVEDFLDELVADNQARMEALDVSLETACDSFLSGFFDEGLVRGVLASTIGNAERYTRDLIRLSADEQDGYLVFRIEDNGAGYPRAMLDAQESTENGDAFQGGHTQLGLYFAREIARLHCSGERTGFIRLANDCGLPGGCFELWLP